MKKIRSKPRRRKRLQFKGVATQTASKKGLSSLAMVWLRRMTFTASAVYLCFNLVQDLFWIHTTAQDYAPNISVIDQPTQFPSRSLGTEFRVKNNGKIDLTNLSFSCVIDELGNGKYTSELISNFPGQEVLPSLKTGQEITRNCGTYFARIPAKKLRFKVTYAAFGSPKRYSVEKPYTIELGERGFYAKPLD